MCAIAQVVDNAFRAQLLDRLDHMIEPVNVRLGQQATMGVHGQIAVETIVAFSDPRPDLSLLYQAEVFDVRHAHECEGIVDLGDDDIPRSDARAFVKERSGIGPIGLPETRGLTLTAHARHDVNRRMLQIARAFRRSDHQRHTAVALLAAIEQAERINDPARALMVIDGDRFSHHRLLVEGSMAALGNSQVGKIQCRGAVPRHVSRGDGTEGSGGMVNAERSGELRIALDVVGPLRSCGASLAITIARLENQYVLTDP